MYKLYDGTGTGGVTARMMSLEAVVTPRDSPCVLYMILMWLFHG